MQRSQAGSIRVKEEPVEAEINSSSSKRRRPAPGAYRYSPEKEISPKKKAARSLKAKRRIESEPADMKPVARKYNNKRK